MTTVELYNLNAACVSISRAFDTLPYLVGSATDGTKEARDVDVRLMLDDDVFKAVCPTQHRWDLLCMAISAYLTERTGLPIDFQIQQLSLANERYAANRRYALGMEYRTFAGGGDATPQFEINNPNLGE